MAVQEILGASSSETFAGLEWPRLVTGTLLRRYKRFMADVKLRNGRVVTAHCPNSGSMLGCSEPGRPVYLSRSNNPARRFPYTWELIEMPTSLVGVNTSVPNRLTAESIIHGRVGELSGYGRLRREVRCGTNSRIDLLLEKDDGRLCYVEVKNCTLVEGGIAYFPDAVTERGTKHLRELRQLVAEGHRAAMFYLIQRMDAQRFRPADHIDPEYGRELRRAVKKGVEVVVYDVGISLEVIGLHRAVPFDL